MNKLIFRGRKVGHIEGDTYVTKRLPHQVMVMYKGFGISSGVLSLITTDLAVKKVIIEYHSIALQRIYHFDIMDFLTSKKEWIDHTTDGVQDIQKFVSLEEQDWDEIKSGLPWFKKKEDKNAQPTIQK